MTHEELRAKISRYLHPTVKLTGHDLIKNAAIGFLEALLDVVDLHEPDEIFCSECSYDDQYVIYPCSTIDAIVRRLENA